MVDAAYIAGTAMLGVALVAACAALLIAPGRPVNRMLALVIFADALAWLTPMPGRVAGDPDAIRAGKFLAVAFTDAIPGLYLVFLGLALAIPLTRPLANRWVRLALFAHAAVAFMLAVNTPDAVNVRGPFQLGNPGMGAAYLFGFVAALWSVRATRAGTLQRRRAIAFALAFGIRDVLQVPFLLSTDLLMSGVTIWFVVASQLALVVFLAYGILQMQLFDADLKLKWTLRRGTVATAFLLVFFVVSQLIERMASERLGYISGAVAAGVMLLAINPLQKTADRFADKAMPKTEATPAYVAFRKMEVYKAAVEEVLADGKMSDKDRRVLDRLRTQLGLAASDAGSMERDIATTRGVA